jgi:hypothetical protein
MKTSFLDNAAPRTDSDTAVLRAGNLIETFNEDENAGSDLRTSLGSGTGSGTGSGSGSGTGSGSGSGSGSSY